MTFEGINEEIKWYIKQNLHPLGKSHDMPLLYCMYDLRGW